MDDNDGNTSNEATVTVTYGEAPVAQDDTQANPVIGSPTEVDVLANDSDADGDMLTVDSVSTADNGRVVVDVDSTVTYTPDAGFVGTDSFTYSNADGFGGFATATVTVDVTNQEPVAVDDVYGTQQDQALSVPVPGVLVNDSDADGDGEREAGEVPGVVQLHLETVRPGRRRPGLAGALVVGGVDPRDTCVVQQ